VFRTECVEVVSGVTSRVPPAHSETNDSKSSTPLAGAARLPDVVATAVAHQFLIPARQDLPDRPVENHMRGWRLISCVLLPFAGGFYISYLFRTINALISGELTSDLGLGAADLGLLTSIFFLTVAVAQIPIGVLLDRYGPRRVQSALLLVAAGGAALFATSEGFAALVLARALIGLGVAAALTAGLKAIVQWFPKERVALANGSIVMLGALGAVTATAPAELLLASTGWRGLFELFAVATAGVAVLIYLVVPDAPAATASKRSAPVSLKTVYTDPRFWRLAPLSATCAGSAWALQGLWAAPWLTDVEGVDRSGLIRHLFVMAVAVSAGSFLLGVAADRLRRRGIGAQALLTIVATAFITTQLALILRLPLPSYLPWAIVATMGAGHVLSYTILAEYFPAEVAGRANGALNVLHFGAAFVLQYSIGLVLEQWARYDGHYPTIAYQAAFGLVIALQVVALVWFELSRARRLWSVFRSNLFRRVLDRSRAASNLAQPTRELPDFGQINTIPLVPDFGIASSRGAAEMDRPAGPHGCA
jgi:sugar phosphate permease